VSSTPDVCYIDVQPLPRNMPNSQSIIFGADFFNSFTMLRQMGPFGGINSMTLALSDKGQSSGSIINIYFYTPGPNPFTITPTVVQSSQIVNGMPTLKVNMTNGFTGQNTTTPSFFFDMWASETFVYSSSCVQLNGTNGTNSSASCSAAPVLASSLFNPTGDWEHPATLLSQGGYNLQGNAVPQLLQFQDLQSTSRFQQVYSVSGVIADTWLNNQEALYGQVGFGPMSPLSLQFIDPETML
jgi:hypothetical protein